jgi:hypothetical protein
MFNSYSNNLSPTTASNKKKLINDAHNIPLAITPNQDGGDGVES